jgi:valyl-tRNA synthetase
MVGYPIDGSCIDRGSIFWIYGIFTIDHTVLLYATGTMLKLLHPFIPHVTEKIWQSIPFDGVLMIQEYPQTINLHTDNTLADNFMEMVRAYRNLRTEAGLKQQEKCLLHFSGDVSMQTFIEQNKAILQKLAQAEDVLFDGSNEWFVTGIFQDASLWVKSNQEIDVEAVKAKLCAELEAKKKQISGLEAQLANERFVNSAPAQVVQDRKDSLEEAKKTVASIQAELGKLE